MDHDKRFNLYYVAVMIYRKQLEETYCMSSPLCQTFWLGHQLCTLHIGSGLFLPLPLPHPPIQCSGLSSVIGTQLEGLGALSPAGVAFISSVVVAIVTQVVSNTATTTLFLPILAELVSSSCC